MKERASVRGVRLDACPVIGAAMRIRTPGQIVAHSWVASFSSICKFLAVDMNIAHNDAQWNRAADDN